MSKGILSKGITLSVDGKEISNLQQIPSLGGTPEKVEVTTLADESIQYINGLKDYGDLEFKFLYDNSGESSNYRTLKKIEQAGEAVECIVTLPDTTTFTFNAVIAVSLDEASVNSALTFTCSCGLQSDITVENPGEPE